MKTVFLTFICICVIALHVSSQNDSTHNSSRPLPPENLFIKLADLSSDSCFCDNPSYYSIKLDSLGNITELILIKGTSDCMNKKIQEIIWNSSPWTPAYKEGYAIPYIFTLPVIFKTPISQPCE